MWILVSSFGDFTPFRSKDGSNFFQALIGCWFWSTMIYIGHLRRPMGAFFVTWGCPISTPVMPNTRYIAVACTSLCLTIQGLCSRYCFVNRMNAWRVCWVQNGQGFGKNDWHEKLYHIGEILILECPCLLPPEWIFHIPLNGSLNHMFLWLEYYFNSNPVLITLRASIHTRRCSKIWFTFASKIEVT